MPRDCRVITVRESQSQRRICDAGSPPLLARTRNPAHAPPQRAGGRPPSRARAVARAERSGSRELAGETAAYGTSTAKLPSVGSGDTGLPAVPLSSRMKVSTSTAPEAQSGLAGIV
jgi:hypothetical protein